MKSIHARRTPYLKHLISHGAEYSASIVHKALKWVMCAFRPLTSRELLAAVRIEVEDETAGSGEEVTEEDLLGWCANLLVLDTETNPAVWKACHFSVIEPLQTMWSMQDAHRLVAKYRSGIRHFATWA